MPSLTLRVTSVGDYVTLIATHPDEDDQPAFAGALAVSNWWATQTALAEAEVGDTVEVEVPAQ